MFYQNIAMFSNTFQQKTSNVYHCIICDYYTSRKSNYDEHILTRKHQKSMLSNPEQSIRHKKPVNPATSFSCQKCGKLYKDNSGLWRHKQKCNILDIHTKHSGLNLDQEPNTGPDNNIMSDKELIIMLVKQNSELMNVIKNGTHNNHSHNNNSNNKTFNLQFFLNETCKDAMNIGEFVSSIKPQISELEATGRLGYAEGISNIILNNLKSLDTQTRPIHCSDQKREIIYIKENNEWTKEEEDKPILTRAIKTIANENIKNINEWRKANPDCTDAESIKNNLYLKIVSNSMSGSSYEESNKNINKIISNVAKNVTINKTI
jgi:hypothetical protein